MQHGIQYEVTVDRYADASVAHRGYMLLCSQGGTLPGAAGGVVRVARLVTGPSEWPSVIGLYDIRGDHADMWDWSPDGLTDYYHPTGDGKYRHDRLPYEEWRH